MSAIFETDLTPRQVDVLYEIYAHYLGKPRDSSAPLYFELVPMSEIIETWYPLHKANLVALVSWNDSYDPYGKFFYVRLTSLGRKLVNRVLKAISKTPIKRLPELLASEFAFISVTAEKRLQEIGDG